MNSLQEMGLPRFPLLSERETLRLLKKAHKGDHRAREKLINCNFRLVFNIVKRFEGRGFDLEDLFQIGAIGLIKAIDNFDVTYGVKFSTYAVPMIIGEIRRFLRDDRPVKVSRALKEKGIRVKRIREQLVREFGREPTIAEIADALELGKDEVVTALEATQLPISIFETFYHDENKDNLCILDHLKIEDEEEQVWLEKIALREALLNLPDRERKIIWLRFFQDKTQAEVGALLGLSQVQVSRLERQAVAKLRKYLHSP
ncbi:MAG: SigF/SigG family RNA polymerase sporulation sigma factor [Bacillota bacterium]|nr:SigF/SigG family RNA polymerase sporulation sigma factor [Bacillota bacterium]